MESRLHIGARNRWSGDAGGTRFSGSMRSSLSDRCPQAKADRAVRTGIVALRGDVKWHLQAEAEWTSAMHAAGDAQHGDCVSFDDVVYVLSRSKGISRSDVLWLRHRIWETLNDRYRIRADDTSSQVGPIWPIAAERSNRTIILDMLHSGEQEPAGMV